MQKEARLVPVRVTGLDEEGLAVGALDGDRRVHVKGVRVAAGVEAEVTVQIVKRRRRHAFGIVASGSRVSSAAACSAYPRCGGCAIQHLDSAAQLELKRKRLVASLRGAGVILAVAPSIVTGPRFHYRRRARLGVRHLRERDETLVGFRESFGSRVARIDACLVLAEPLSSALPEIQRVLATLDARARVPQVELAAGDDAGALVVRHLDPLDRDDCARLRALEASTGLAVFVQAAGVDSIARIGGGQARRLHYRLDRFGVALEFAPTDFVQANGVLNRDLVAAAVALVAPGRHERIVDLFCGIGNFTLPLARGGADVVGIEHGDALVAAARRNAAVNRLGTRVELVAADLYRSLPAHAGAHLAQADALLVDPPRTGLGPLASVMSAPRLSRIVYASCHAPSFAADAARLDALGFRLARLDLFDMFPHTAHAETLALFNRR